MFCQELVKLDEVRLNYHKYKKVTLFSVQSCAINYVPINVQFITVEESEAVDVFLQKISQLRHILSVAAPTLRVIVECNVWNVGTIT